MAARTLLPLGRRWPVGPDEGAFIIAHEVPPHQFGQMTYDRAMKGILVAGEASAAVSHGLTSSPRGERGRLNFAVMSESLRQGTPHREGMR